MGITQKNVLSQPIGTHLIEPNLYLRVQASGASFFFRYMQGGNRRDIGVGSARKVTIARAREIAALYRAEIAAGRDPKLKKKAEAGARAVRTFKAVAREAVENTEQVRQWKNPTHRSNWDRRLEMYVYPLIGSMPINEVTRADVIRVLQPIWETKTPTATYVRGAMERIFSVAIFAGEYTGPNPAVYRGNLDVVLPSPKKIHHGEHQRAMTLERTREAMRFFLESRSAPCIAIAIIILTALRCGEVTLAEWSEIDLDAAVFSVPAIRRKVARDYPHRVPLPLQAVAILRRLAELGTDGYVFKSEKIKGNPVSHSAVKDTMLKNFPDGTVHGFRSTFRMWAEEAEQNTSAAEYQMMHENRSAVVRAYQRSDLLDQRRVLMQRWADEIISLEEVEKILAVD